MLVQMPKMIRPLLLFCVGLSLTMSVDLLSVGTWSKYVIFDFYTIPISPLPLKFALVDIAQFKLDI